MKVTSPLVADIIAQDQNKQLDTSKVIEIKASVRRLLQDQHVLAKEKGASSWLSVLPIDDLPPQGRCTLSSLWPSQPSRQ